MFFGIENISSTLVQQISKLYCPIIPFMLHGDSRAIYTNKLSPPFAVYTPLTHSIPNEEAIKPLLGYLLRRKTTQQALRKGGYCFLTPPMNKSYWDDLIPEIQAILRSSFHRFVLTSQNFHSRMEAFFQNGVKLVVGNSTLPEHFFELVKSFRINLAKSSID